MLEKNNHEKYATLKNAIKEISRLGSLKYVPEERPKNRISRDKERKKMKTVYSYDDVLLVPKYSSVETRSQVNLSSNLDSFLNLDMPVISSPMDTVTEASMASSMHDHGGLGIIHRYNSIEEQVKLVRDCKTDMRCTVGAAIGATGDFVDRAAALYEAGARVLCIDVAHGHHSLMKTALSQIRKTLGNKVHVMAGNVATRQAIESLADWGADSVRVGIGGGSICSTRLVTGHGIPTFQSVLDCAETSSDIKIIADGGIRTTGDMVKALAAGADFVMVGSMLAGTNESPGEVFSDNAGKKYKVYRGMASANAQKSWRGKSSTPEGISTTIPYKGPVSDILTNIAGGLRSGLSYSGARTLSEFQAKCEFILQSSAGMAESSTHILSRYK